MSSTMGLGTKNRLLQTANDCKNHLRALFPAQLELVNEFIAEIEGGGRDHMAWDRFSDLKRSRAELLVRVEAEFREWLG